MIKCEKCHFWIESNDAHRTITVDGRIKAVCIDEENCKWQFKSIQRKVYCDICHTWRFPNEITYYTRNYFPKAYQDNRMSDYASCNDRVACEKRRKEDIELTRKDKP